jgi:hypothetical protein
MPIATMAQPVTKRVDDSITTGGGVAADSPAMTGTTSEYASTRARVQGERHGRAVSWRAESGQKRRNVGVSIRKSRRKRGSNQAYRHLCRRRRLP